MSASNRAIARLPLSIFTDLVTPPPPADGCGNAAANAASTMLSPEDLRQQISQKLRDFHQRQGQPSTIYGAGSKPREGTATVGQLLKLAPSALLRAVDPLLTDIECRRMIDRICQVCAPRPRSALELLQSQQQQPPPPQSESQSIAAATVSPPFTHITSGMDNLDQCLRGGFRVGSITEVVGRAGVGKSQLATQLCIMAARMGRGSVYIDTERKVSLRRMKEMAQERRTAQLGGGGGASGMSYAGEQFSYHHHHHNNQQQQQQYQEGQNTGGTGTNTQILNGDGDGDGVVVGGTYKDALEVLENVTIHTPASTKELLNLIHTIEEEILIRNDEALTSSGDDNTSTTTPKHPVGLVVLDSIAAPTRRDFGAESAMARVNAIFQIAQTLKRIADQPRWPSSLSTRWATSTSLGRAMPPSAFRGITAYRRGSCWIMRWIRTELLEAAAAVGMMKPLGTFALHEWSKATLLHRVR